MKTLVIDASVCNKKRNLSFFTYLNDLLNYFHAHRGEIRFDKIILACGESEYDSFQRYNDKFDVIPLDCSSNIKKLLYQRKYWKMFNLSKDDLILWPGCFSSTNKHCNHLLVMHDLLYLRKDLAKTLPLSWKLHRILLYPRSVKMADKVISITKWVKEDIINNYKVKNTEKIVPIYNYSDFRKYKYAGVDRKSIDHIGENGLVIPDDYFLVVSQDYYHKNIITVIKAFEKYAERNKDCKLVLVSRLSQERKDYISSLDESIKSRILVYKGISDDDLSKLYRCTKAFIMATMFEGMGVPFIEAMYHGVRLVSSNIEVAKEVTNGKAVYFNPTDADELCDILVHIEDYPEPGDCRAEIDETYGPANTCGRYIEVINTFA